tara:strand:- start:349 stop:777 length:429 start_codon:yes stop_codon:yes gene_type:complete
VSGIIGGVGSRSGVIGETEIDYEEGTWTVAIAGAGGVGPYGLSQLTGYYTKTGRIVEISWTVTLASIGSVSGDGQIYQLPFTADGDGAWHVLYGDPFDGSCKGGYISGTSMYPMDNLSDAVAQWTASSDQKWKIWGTYKTAS